MRALPVVLVLLATVSLAAQPLHDFERVLIPAFANPPIAGVYGSQFAASARLYAPAGTRYFPDYAGHATPEVGTFPRSMLWTMFVPGPPSRVGRFLFVERARAGETVIDARFSSRAAEKAAERQIRLPVVREGDFRSAAFSIAEMISAYTLVETGSCCCRIAIPQYRHTLRVYAYDERGGAVRVRVFAESVGGLVTIDETLQIASREGDDPTYPLYAEMQIPELCAGISCHTPCLSGMGQRVEITPLTEGLRVWAVVSETHNVTQDVTLLYAE